MRRTKLFAVLALVVAAATAGALCVATCTAADDPAPPTGAPKAGETITTPTRAAKTDAPVEAAGGAAPAKALPFITVDRKKGTVTVDGVVCLNEGVLELFACANETRMHEAIVHLAARPRDINVALILLGRAPGHPAVWTKDGKFLPPYGPVFRVFIHWTKEGKPQRVEAHQWLTDTTTEKQAKPLKWVFCGGATREGHFLPDYEGTVVCLSNFEAPILDVPFESSDKNSDLLYKARTEAIPEPGTPVKLVIEATKETITGKKLQWALAIAADGSMTLEGEPATLEALDQKLKNRDEYLLKVQIFTDPAAPAGRMLDAMNVITKYALNVELYKKAQAEPQPKPDTPEPAPKKAPPKTAPATGGS